MAQDTNAYRSIKNILINEGIDPRKGLGTEVFMLTSCLTPIVNVDMLVRNDRNQILLSKRDDISGHGWHIPGGCVRLGETLTERLVKTMRAELGKDISYNPVPVCHKEIILPNDGWQERTHFISFLFDCRVDENTPDCGFDCQRYGLKWFDRLPADFIDVQKVYYDVLTPYL